MASSASAILSAVSCLEAAAGRFAAAVGNLRELALETARGLVLLGFFDILRVPDHAAISGQMADRKRCK
jgi:hypothetical protein